MNDEDQAATTVIEFFFDCSSPWTWLGFHNIQPLARELGVQIDWKPVLLGAVFNAVNPSVYAFRESGPQPKKAYVAKDLQDWARRSGLTIVFPPRVFPVNSVKAMRGCLWLQPQGKLVAFAGAAFEAYWRREEDISDDEVLANICRGIGVDASAFLAGIADDSIKAQLRRNTDELMARGGFGTPTIYVGGDDMYFGNDRLVLVREAVLRRQGRS